MLIIVWQTEENQLNTSKCTLVLSAEPQRRQNDSVEYIMFCKISHVQSKNITFPSDAPAAAVIKYVFIVKFEYWTLLFRNEVHSTTLHSGVFFPNQKQHSGFQV